MPASPALPARPQPAGSRLRALLGALLAAVLLGGGLVGLQAQSPAAPVDAAEAASAANFKPGNLISDADFFNASSMDASGVQSFLDSKVSSCQSGYTCLKDYAMATPTRAADAYCGTYSGGWQTAAQIIAGVGRACGVSPKVLLVMLQKETSLVTMRGPASWRYDRAMGYYCPDDPNRPGWCDPEYGGLFNQLYYAARQFQIYKAKPTSFNFIAGTTTRIAYHPNSYPPASSCGFQTVTIENQATAGLYNYTPYQPNQAALSNLYGEGDGCSAYGNRNFWRDYTDWFGASRERGPRDPAGGIDQVVAAPGGITVSGWAVDPDAPTTSLAIWVTIDGVGQHIMADQSRPDVAAALPGYGDLHGFHATLPASVGVHSVCITPHNIGEGQHFLFGCRSVEVVPYAPIGNFESASGGVGELRVDGWTADRDGAPPRYLWISVDGRGTHYNHNVDRPDVQRVHPWAELGTGFSHRIAASPGAHQVCVSVANSGPAAPNSNLGCRTVTVKGEAPFGNYEFAEGVAGGVRVGGWAADWNDPSFPLYVWVSVDGQGRYIRAETLRPDVDRVYPGLGQRHGFDAVVAAPRGQHTVCVSLQGVGAGGNAQLGCRVVTTP